MSEDVPVEFGGGGSPEGPQDVVIESASQDQVLAPAQSDHSILRDIETASETIALYTAIIGKRPEIVGPFDESADGPILTISPHWPHKNRQVISFWFRRMSQQARRHLDHAFTRLAS